MGISDKIKNIKEQLRSFMNGAVSHSMRKKGIDEYKINFGVEYPRLKEIAATQEPSLPLAEALWIENIRECKILATLLYPKSEFTLDTANIWIREIPNLEIGRFLCVNLLQDMEYAPGLSFSCIASDNPIIQSIGYILISRLLPNKLKMNGRAADEFINQISSIAGTEDLGLKQAALQAVIGFMEQGPEAKLQIIAMAESLDSSENQFAKVFHDAILEEASYL